MMKVSSSTVNSLLKCLCSLVLVVSLYLFFIILFNRSLADYDLWGYLSFGRVFWEEGFFPYQDIFSYTPTKPLWVYHEWLTGIVLYTLLKYSGPAGLQLLRYTLSILTIYFIYSTALKRGGSSFYALMILIPSMILISFGYEPIRAQIFTFFFFILTLYILECAKIKRSVTILRWLPLIQIVWCNFHGGFIAGLGLIFLYALGEGMARKKIGIFYLKWGTLASLVTLINPYGMEYWIYTIHAVSMPRPEITEWYSVVTALKSRAYIFPVSLFLTMSLIILLVFLIRKKKDITEFLVIAVLIYLGCVHIRHGVIFGLLFGAYMPVYLSNFSHEWNTKYKPFKYLFRFVPIIFSFLLVVTYFYFYSIKQITFSPSFRVIASAQYYPTNAILWLQANHIKGNILPNFEWGEYLIWSCYPDCRVAMDGRYETVYNDDVHKEYFDFINGKDRWDIFLKKYPHDIVLLKAGSKTHSLMINDKGWHVAYHDNLSVLFMKKR